MRRVVLVAFNGAQGLDIFGPAEVFAAVARQACGTAYEVVLAAVGGGRIRATSGLVVASLPLARIRPVSSDTVLVVGGDEHAIRASVASGPLITWLSRASPIVARIGSVCSGAFVLARAGLLDGRRAATHWSSCDRLAAFRPQATVDSNAIFVKDGNVWTSAGVTAGIDMALAIVEEDCGARVADAIAARFVLHSRRPGFQSQLSDVLAAQSASSDPLGPAVAWARANLRRGMGVPQLARKAGASTRTFHRRCVDKLGITPAKLVERLRVEQAQTLLLTTSLGTKTIATLCGFVSAPRMARAFARTLGVGPTEYRAFTAHRTASPGS